jgi:hypothetical protein
MNYTYSYFFLVSYTVLSFILWTFFSFISINKDLLEKFENEEILLRLPSLLTKFDDFIHSSGLDWRKNVDFLK